jgi:hypothetical protein
MASTRLWFLPLLAATGLAASPSLANELVRFDDASRDFSTAIGRQVDGVFATDFAAAHLKGNAAQLLYITALAADTVCFYGRGDAFELAGSAMEPFLRQDEGDWCVPRAALSFRYTASTETSLPPKPYGATDVAACQWNWKTGGGLGLWTETCGLETGTWAVDYNDDASGFVLTVNGENAFTVVQAFPMDISGIEAVIPVLDKRGLLPSGGECVFAPVEGMPPQGTRHFFEIVPVGARKKAYDALPSDEVPEPPCGDYGMSASGVSYFFTDDAIPGLAIYVNLGQDGTMIEESSISKR